MRPSGGISPSMMNYANGTDVYKIWADMIVFDDSTKGCERQEVCCMASRRYGRDFVLSYEEVSEKYKDILIEEGPIEPALSGAMADYMYLANFRTEEEARAFAADVLKERTQ